MKTRHLVHGKSRPSCEGQHVASYMKLFIILYINVLWSKIWDSIMFPCKITFCTEHALLLSRLDGEMMGCSSRTSSSKQCPSRNNTLSGETTLVKYDFVPFWKWVYSIRKEFAPIGSKFFPYRIDPIFIGSKFLPCRVDSFLERAWHSLKQTGSHRSYLP